MRWRRRWLDGGRLRRRRWEIEDGRWGEAGDGLPFLWDWDRGWENVELQTLNPFFAKASKGLLSQKGLALLGRRCTT